MTPEEIQAIRQQVITPEFLHGVHSGAALTLLKRHAAEIGLHRLTFREGGELLRVLTCALCSGSSVILHMQLIGADISPIVALAERIEAGNQTPPGPGEKGFPA